MFYGTQNVFYSLCNPSKAVNTEIFRQKAQKKTHTKKHTPKNLTIHNTTIQLPEKKVNACQLMNMKHSK